MFTRLRFIFFCALTHLIGVARGPEVWQQQPGPTPRYHAIVTLRTADNNGYYLGQIQLLQYFAHAPTTLMGVVQLLPNSVRDQFLAIHVHEYGDISEGCKWVGRHYNPHNQPHGAPTDQIRHVGDLGNISPTGQVILINITDPHVQLVGDNTVIGRSLVIHSNRDDLGRGFSASSKIDGNSGYPLACGVIAVKGDFSPAAAICTRPGTFVYALCFVLAVLLKML